MVKSPSCFKIITCGSDTAEKDDREVTEGKSSGDKRGWGFGKRSARHRVLSNTVTTETPTLKEAQEISTVNREIEANVTLAEKISVASYDNEEKKPQLASFLKSEEVPDKPVLKEEEEQSETGVKKEELPEEVSAVKEESPEPVVKEELTGVVVIEESPEPEVKEELPGPVVTVESPEPVVKEELLGPVVKEELPEPVVKEELPEDPDALVSVIESEPGTDPEIDESAVIMIQTAVRGFLARRELLKLKKVVKLQAAVRGHIVRRHAAGTLRCVQAIVKMQALVRARRARLSLEESRQICDSKEDENLVKKSSGLNTSIEKLLSNKFARQMLESTPKTKPIHVKCDPLKPDSAWKWLERWMAVSSVKRTDSNKELLVTEELEREKDLKIDPSLEAEVGPEIICDSVDSKCSSVHESVAPSESEDNLITYEADKFDFQNCRYTDPSATHNSENPEFHNTSKPEVRESSVEDVISIVDKDISQSTVDSQIGQQSRLSSTEILASEEPQTDGNKLEYESKKSNNSSFREAQLKFEELSSVAQPVIPSKETSITESPVHGTRIQVGGSECGTELSVTSTLDSPDRSDIGVTAEPEPEPNVQEPDLSTLDQNKNGEPDTAVIVSTHVAATPEASPMSHSTVLESQGTPSSQVSVKDSKKKPSKKRLSLSSSAVKKSPSNPNHDSGSRSSVEKQTKEQRNTKGRSSFGSPKPENGDQHEARNSTGNANNSLPHFMQATESARAKLGHPNSSPRSSPDVVQDGDGYLKKRQSLPGSNGRQGSPRIQRSTSQAQPKSNERKWQR